MCLTTNQKLLVKLDQSLHRELPIFEFNQPNSDIHPSKDPELVPKKTGNYFLGPGRSKATFDQEQRRSERLAKRYWDKLFKEYCLVDLSRYKENKFGMRWRIEKEVISGKGQFTCGNVVCTAGTKDRLRSWEVNFAYKEHGQKRNALVKLRLCPACSDKLNYNHRRRDVTGRSLASFTSEEHKETETDPNSTETVACKRSKTDSLEPDEDSSQTDTSIWETGNQPRTKGPDVLKTQDEEFDAYFADMLI